jgi:tripartite-type tricarboxylate transporter receptor subunit TctC
MQTFSLDLVLAAAAQLAWRSWGAQAGPNELVKAIAVFPAGGSVDKVVRVIAQQSSGQIGPVARNIAGATAWIDTPSLCQAPPTRPSIGLKVAL